MATDTMPDATYAFVLPSGEQIRSFRPVSLSTGGKYTTMNAQYVPEYIDGNTVKFTDQSEPVEWTEGWRTGLREWTRDPNDLVGGWLRHTDPNKRFYDSGGALVPVKWHSVNEIEALTRRGDYNGEYHYWTPLMSHWEHLGALPASRPDAIRRRMPR